MDRPRLERQIGGALRSQIDAHGAITREWIGSAAKRVLTQLYKGDTEPRRELDVRDQLAAAGFEERNGLWRRGEEVGAVATEAGVFVGWLDVAWPRLSTPESQLRDVVHLPPGRLDELKLTAALDRARERREAALRTCRYCGERCVPGHMHSEDVCQGCAERHLGVAH
jgi:hypothetical protein